MELPSDAVVQKFSLDMKYQVNIPDKKDWEKSPSVRADSDWCTGPSKTEYRTETGLYGRRPKKCPFDKV